MSDDAAHGELPVVDVHTHLAPLLERTSLANVGFRASADGRYEFADTGRALGPAPLYDTAALGAYLDAQAIDSAWVSAPPPFFRQQLGEAEAAAWIPILAEGIARACAPDDRLRPLLHLPLEHPALAARTVRAYMADDRFAGWAGAAGGASTALDEPAFEQMWSLIAADGRPLLLHPAATPDRRLKPHYLHNLLGNPVETAVAVGQLVFGRVLETHPQLRIVLVHCGGAVPSVAARWQHGLDTARPGVSRDMRPVADTLRTLYTDCLTHDPANIELARHVFGDDRLLLGSDWPFPMGLENPREPLRDLPTGLQERIARINPHSVGRLAPHS